MSPSTLHFDGYPDRRVGLARPVP